MPVLPAGPRVLVGAGLAPALGDRQGRPYKGFSPNVIGSALPVSFLRRQESRLNACLAQSAGRWRNAGRSQARRPAVPGSLSGLSPCVISSVDVLESLAKNLSSPGLRLSPDLSLGGRGTQYGPWRLLTAGCCLPAGKATQRVAATGHLPTADC